MPSSNVVNIKWMELLRESLDGTDPAVSTCTCGRPLDFKKPHCHECGGQNLYASGHKIAKNLPGPPSMNIWVNGFKCRRCGTHFWEHEPCEAPAPTVSMKERRKQDDSSEALERAMAASGFTERSAYVKHLFQKIGRATSPASPDPIDNLPLGEADPLRGLPKVQSDSDDLILGVPVDKPPSEDKEKP